MGGTVSVTLANSITAFAAAAASAQQYFKSNNDNMELSLFEFQFETQITSGVSLDLTAQFGAGANTDDSSSVGLGAVDTNAKAVGLMIHCVIQNTALAESFKASSANVAGLSVKAAAPNAPSASGGKGLRG